MISHTVKRVYAPAPHRNLSLSGLHSLQNKLQQCARRKHAISPAWHVWFTRLHGSASSKHQLVRRNTIGDLCTTFSQAPCPEQSSTYVKLPVWAGAPIATMQGWTY